MDNKLILPCEVENVSDGYHTFKELYEHRITLFIALCKQLSEKIEADNISGVFKSGISNKIWRSKKHNDGSVWSGWFIMGINLDKDEQITYHLPIEKWKETSFAYTLDKAPEFDGHTPKDVLKRIKNL